MTTPRDISPLLDADARAIAAAIARRIEFERTIDTRAALEGIRANRSIRRNHRHSVSHRAYR